MSVTRVALVVALAITACRGSKAARHDDVGSAPKPSPSDSAESRLPRLPQGPDPAVELAELDRRITLDRDLADRGVIFVGSLLQRASVRGDLDDYQEAVAYTKAWIARAPKDPQAWRARVEVLSRVHEFAEARAALKTLTTLVPDPGEVQDLVTTIDEATGHLDRSQPVRDGAVRLYPSTVNLVQQAGGLALAGKLDEALAIMPKAAVALRGVSPVLINWLLFQWGRLYEQRGEPAAARDFFAEARRRLPTLESITHLAQTMIATGDAAGAKQLVDDELAHHRHPELLGLAVQLGHAELADEARTAWERYVAALPLAFADHAARFYLGPGKNPTRALVLAKQNLANRDTHEARALVVEAALAAGDAKTACDAAAPLAEPTGSHADRFAAWKALSACGRHEEADRLAKDLGITH